MARKPQGNRRTHTNELNGESEAATSDSQTRNLDDIAQSLIISSDSSSAAQDGESPAGDSGDRSFVDDDPSGTITDDAEDNEEVSADAEQADETAEQPEDTTSETEDDDPLLGDIFNADTEGATDGAETDSIDTSKLGEDVEFSVTVDGEDRKVTLGDLKARYAGEGAIDRRLQEASEARKAAVQQYETGKTFVKEVFEDFGKLMFRRIVEEPSTDLLNSDPAAYMKQKALYDEETSSLNAAFQQIQTKMVALDSDNAKAKTARREEAAAELRRVLPVLNDPVKGPPVQKAIVDTAFKLGFTEDEIKGAEDHRIFVALAHAARDIKRSSMSKVVTTTTTTAARRSNGVNRTQRNSTDRNHAAKVKKAQQTGKVDDVAATLVMQNPDSRTSRRF